MSKATFGSSGAIRGFPARGSIYKANTIATKYSIKNNISMKYLDCFIP